MEAKLKKLLNQAKDELEQIKDSQILADLKNKYLGRKGELASLLKDIKNVAAEERPVVGQIANEVKNELLSVDIVSRADLSR
jgi:phenylalanyl-tRNA synthetase alpha chain